tara:strand:+ start:241 stop:732 length:492 start_codon:yes stop_codon:yes gene_type:complete
MLISEAFAQAAAPAQTEASLMSLLPIIGIFVIFYFLLIRPQSKRAKEQKKMVEALQRGDEIITSGGALGQILNVSESYVVVEIAPNVEVIILKTAVQTLLPKGTLKSIEPPKSGKGQKNNKTLKNSATQEKKPAPIAEDKADTTSDSNSDSNDDAAPKNEDKN